MSKPVPVGVLTKVLKVFDFLQRAPAGLSLKQVSDQAGLSKSTAYRFLAHLEREGYLVRDDTGLYTFGIKFLQLAATLNHQSSLREVARPCLRELLRVTGESVNLGVLDGGMVVYADVLECSHEFRLVSKIGQRRALYSTALGKALAAFIRDEEREALLSSLNFQSFTPHTLTNLAQLREELEAVRLQGYAVDNEESVLGARCVAAPVLGNNQEALAAISIAGPATRISPDRVPLFAATVKETARKISARISFPEPRRDPPA